MNNQIVEYIQQIVPGAGQSAVAILNQLTAEQRQQLFTLMRDGSVEAYRSAMNMLRQIRSAIDEPMQGRINEFGREFGDHTGFRHPTSPPLSNMPGTDEPVVQGGTPQGRANRLGTASAATNGVMMGTAHGETSIDPYSFVKSTPWRRTETVKMDYYAFPSATSITTTAPAQWSYRLNSIYDCRDTSTYSDIEAPAVNTAPTADAADGTVNYPTWRGYWLNFYKYWTVVETKWRFRFHVIPTDQGNSDIQLMVYVYHHGIQKPPLYAEPTGGANTLITHQFRRQHSGMFFFPITYTPNVKGESLLVDMDRNACSGTWTPGSIKHEVAEDELQQIWHKQTEVPPTREGITIIVQKSPTDTYGGAVAVRCEASLQYTVQLKDLKREFQYPTQLTAISAIPATDVNQAN